MEKPNYPLLKSIIQKVKESNGKPIELTASEFEIAKEVLFNYKQWLLMNNKYYPDTAANLEEMMRAIEEGLANDSNN